MHDTTLPTTPGAILGHTKNGRPIYLAAGGSGPLGGGDGGQGSGQSGDQNGGGNAGQAGSDQGGTGTGTGQQGGQSGGQQGTSNGGAQDVKDLPDWAQKLIRDTRAEAASHRTKATEAETAKQSSLDAIAKALGLKKDEADPAKLAEQLTGKDNELRQSKVELAVHRLAGKHGGNPDALLDSRSFLTSVKDLDPSGKDFTQAVESAIKDAVKANASLKAAPAGPAVSGGDFTGGTGAGAPITEEQLSKMTPAQISKAYAEGKLKHLM